MHMWRPRKRDIKSVLVYEHDTWLLYMLYNIRQCCISLHRHEMEQQAMSLRWYMPKPLTGWSYLAGSGHKTEEDHLNIEKLTALIVYNNMEICVLFEINLRSIPFGWQHLKNQITVG